MRRIAAICALIALLGSAAGASGSQPSWALPQIKALVSAGVMGTSVATFHPNDPLRRVALEQLVAGLLHRAPVVTPAPTATVTMSGLDSRLDGALGLGATARAFQSAAKAAGIAPPSRFGTETTARLLGLRINHPAAED